MYSPRHFRPIADSDLQCIELSAVMERLEKNPSPLLENLMTKARALKVECGWQQIQANSVGAMTCGGQSCHNSTDTPACLILSQFSRELGIDVQRQVHRITLPTQAFTPLEVIDAVSVIPRISRSKLEKQILRFYYRYWLCFQPL